MNILVYARNASFGFIARAREWAEANLGCGIRVRNSARIRPEDPLEPADVALFEDPGHPLVARYRAIGTQVMTLETRQPETVPPLRIPASRRRR